MYIKVYLGFLLLIITIIDYTECCRPNEPTSNDEINEQDTAPDGCANNATKVISRIYPEKGSASTVVSRTFNQTIAFCLVTSPTGEQLNYSSPPDANKPDVLHFDNHRVSLAKNNETHCKVHIKHILDKDNGTWNFTILLCRGGRGRRQDSVWVIVQDQNMSNIIFVGIGGGVGLILITSLFLCKRKNKNKARRVLDNVVAITDKKDCGTKEKKLPNTEENAPYQDADDTGLKNIKHAGHISSKKQEIDINHATQNAELVSTTENPYYSTLDEFLSQ